MGGEGVEREPPREGQRGLGTNDRVTSTRLEADQITITHVMEDGRLYRGMRLPLAGPAVNAAP